MEGRPESATKHEGRLASETDASSERQNEAMVRADQENTFDLQVGMFLAVLSRKAENDEGSGPFLWKKQGLPEFVFEHSKFHFSQNENSFKMKKEGNMHALSFVFSMNRHSLNTNLIIPPLVFLLQIHINLKIFFLETRSEFEGWQQNTIKGVS